MLKREALSILGCRMSLPVQPLEGRPRFLAGGIRVCTALMAEGVDVGEAQPWSIHISHHDSLVCEMNRL